MSSLTSIVYIFWMDVIFLLRPRKSIAEKFLDATYNLTVGETVIITRSDGRDVSLPIVGLAYDVMYDTYRSEQAPYLYVSESTLRSLFPDKDTWDSSLGLRLSDPQAVDDVLAEIEALRSTKFVESHTDWRDVKESALFKGQLASVFLSAFSFFAILATVIIIISVVNSTILSQIKQIGILKALGFTGGQILLRLCWAVCRFKPDRNHAWIFAWSDIGACADAGCYCVAQHHLQTAFQFFPVHSGLFDRLRRDHTVCPKRCHTRCAGQYH